MKRVLKIVIWILVLAAVGFGGYFLYNRFCVPQKKIIYNSEPALRESIASMTSATGTVEPEELVNVGAQVGGMITTFGKDANGKTIDYGSPVKAGQVLALIDDALYKAAKQEADAQLLQAEAAIASARAEIQQSEAKLELATLNWNRAKELHPRKAMSKSEYDSALSEYHTAAAALSVSQAQLKQAEAKLASAKAGEFKARRNLGYCVIRSPVDGVIIDRRVSIGQTVVSSMSAPSLFLIAKDLRKMQVWVSVNEADIGNIHVGQDVVFTVDAFPEVEFKGVVGKIRLNATMSQNVVTYVVEVITDNSSGKLLPYLTASVRFIRERRDNVLTVPNAAFRYVPDPEIAPAKYRAMAEAAQAVPEARRMKAGPGERQIWLLKNNQLEPVKITTGLSDGILTEVTGGELKENDVVVSGAVVITTSSGDNKDAVSPFVPVRRRKKKK